MASIGGINPSSIRIPTMPDLKKDAVVDDASNPSAPQADAKPVEGVAVTISGAGLQAARNDANKDIDDSNLSDSVKQLLKMIRELKKQLEDKMAELAAAMADTSMTPEARQARVAGLQSDVTSLQAALATTQTQLAKAMKDQPPEAQMEAMSLMAK
ncbi:MULTISPECIES: hypothetical protein [Pseudomonas]|uniref:Chemotaxis protein n=1 Tax=Pseudomonas pergaminensis TaxID=2853159 RepID=A0ABD7TDJ1_9PSED|nr:MULTISPECIES: hypothetical protein [Pseudomonas]PIB46900.1 hypothetical protein AOA57_21555 [Pseudomonas sp. 2588-5]AQT95825.1 hypothetical protein B1R45_22100 [Pseudomonas azotoformans]MBT1261244.1 hypothetical protein [Pseudomonas sp. VS40]MBT1273742.1 hypothetical protein [Pseudomonas sp. VS59]PJK37117.1 hypothetical protein CWC49_28710 [Pseudomonas sp. S09F 262]